ncbi:serine hydrolase domain-containing protein [Solimonas terrae]|uniref:Beta-lactamase family protein n=1 Tax=Solimonas terrae TaxID=1396819 RepID=A0A6M2BRK6_9GAMM|nr:serine hydrolase domain-containing protein [Solimonas terrae]NGY04974.1 beta-lactamase family protein [Solimonas terrae]
MSMKTQIDAVLRQATDAGAVPGVIAMVTDRDKVLYEGAFGRRALDGDAPMTLDTVGLIASMTKALTSVAALQLLEKGQLDLDSPASTWLPALRDVQVLDGFATDGSPITRAPKQPMTLRHLLTHTSGFGYEFLSTDVQKFQAATGTPSVLSATRASLQLPLLFDPGERWEYGIGIDWVGQIVEKLSGQTLGDYLAEHVMAPLGMASTAFTMTPDMRARKAKIHQRVDGKLVPLELELPQPPEIGLGGAGLYGTVGDYLKFVRMILNKGMGERGRVLREDTVALLSQNQMGALTVPSVKTANPMLSNDMPLPPEIPHQWGLATMINTRPLPTGRAAGSLMWAGLTNCYYWIDPQTGIGGVFLTQILPFADVHAMPLFLAFEYTTYQSL